jgi:hypothetical protein
MGECIWPGLQRDSIETDLVANMPAMSIMQTRTRVTTSSRASCCHCRYCDEGYASRKATTWMAAAHCCVAQACKVRGLLLC